MNKSFEIKFSLYKVLEVCNRFNLFTMGNCITPRPKDSEHFEIELKLKDLNLEASSI